MPVSYGPSHRGRDRHGLARRRPQAGLVDHSDLGTRYTSIAFGLRCREAGILQSMGSTGDADNNAMAESYFVSLETEPTSQTVSRGRG